MPAFTHKGKKYHNPVEFALDHIGGMWRVPILWRLAQRTWRYGELKRDLRGVTHKMLSQQLDALESVGLVHRQEFAEVPPRVEYSLTELGQRVMPSLVSLRELGLMLMQVQGLHEHSPVERDLPASA